MIMAFRISYEPQELFRDGVVRLSPEPHDEWRLGTSRGVSPITTAESTLLQELLRETSAADNSASTLGGILLTMRCLRSSRSKTRSTCAENRSFGLRRVTDGAEGDFTGTFKRKNVCNEDFDVKAG